MMRLQLKLFSVILREKKYYLKIYHSTRFYRHCFSRLGFNAVIAMVMAIQLPKEIFLSYFLCGGSGISLPEWIKMQHKHGLCVSLCIRITLKAC